MTLRILASSEVPSSFPRPWPLKASIDAVVVSHEFTDHMHKETLLEVPTSVPVFAASKAASIIKLWRHFDVVVTLSTNLNGQSRDWHVTSVNPLPSWLGSRGSVWTRSICCTTIRLSCLLSPAL